MTDFGGFPELDASEESGDFFAIPVPVPAENIQDTPLKCLAVNEAYVPIFAKALERLKFADAWVGTDADVQRATQQVDHIIGQWLNGDCITCEPEMPLETECVAIGPFHPSVEYWPNHPVLSPDYHPDNFSAPVWITGAGFPGVDENDAIINPASIFTPIILTEHWSVGVPSTRFYFSGTGEVTLTFTNAIQGCMAFAFPDGNPLLGDFVDLASVNIDDIIGLGWVTALLEFLTGGFANEVYHKMKFDTPGEHTITVWYLPVDDEIPFVGFGGGLRRVDYCGDIVVEEEAVMVHDLNLDGCNLELRLDGIPIDTVDLEPCIRAIASAGLRDDGCQLQVFDEESEWVDVPGASYYRTQADCLLTGAIQDEQAGAVNMQLMRARNTRQITDEFSHIDLDFELYNNTPTLLLANRLRTGWFNKATGQTHFVFFANSAGASYRAMDIGELYTARIWNDITRQPAGALQIRQNNPTFAANAFLSLINDNANRQMFEIWGNGRIIQRMSHNNAATGASLMSLRVNADGVSPVAGFGGTVSFEADSTTTTARGQADIRASWATASDAVRQGRLQMRVYDYLGLHTTLDMTAIDGSPAIGFLGTSAKERQVHEAVGVIEAINEINATLEAFGLVTDNTAVIGDESMTTELVTEIYRDFTVHPCGFAASIASGAEWLDEAGWIDHSSSNFFDIFLNFQPGVEFIEVRVRFLADFTSTQEFIVVLDWFQANEAIIIREEIPAGEPTFYSFSAPVFHKSATIAPLRIAVEDLNPGDGSIILQSIDIAVRGLSQLEADEILAPPGSLTRAVRYVDLTDRDSGYQWMDTHGGTQPPLLLFEEQA